jgi:arsenate reductase (thioredoxin)
VDVAHSVAGAAYVTREATTDPGHLIGAIRADGKDWSSRELVRADARRSRSPMKKVLFLCIGNACRSPMAEGFANHYGKGWPTAYSAGSEPAGIIMPNTIEVMREKGIDIAHQRSKGLSEINLLLMHWIIILEETLANSLPTDSLEADVLHWFVPDPVGQPIDAYRKVRDEIETMVLEFIQMAQHET